MPPEAKNPSIQPLSPHRNAFVVTDAHAVLALTADPPAINVRAELAELPATPENLFLRRIVQLLFKAGKACVQDQRLVEILESLLVELPPLLARQTGPVRMAGIAALCDCERCRNARAAGAARPH